ncbi:MAG: hypothetical protein AAF039_12485 [Bacteroidota bacterium]
MRNSIFLILLFKTLTTASQSKDWEISATNIDPNNYFGITVANGMVGLVSSPEPKSKQIVMINLAKLVLTLILSLIMILF